MNATDLRKRMTQNAMAYNKYITVAYAESLTLESLARFTHPIDRPGFHKEIEKLIEHVESNPVTK